MLDKLNQAFDQAENAQAIVVLTGQPCMLSGGYDLKVMRDSMTAAMALVEKGQHLQGVCCLPLSCFGGMQWARDC
jgi:enoyl-CoA hydratase